MKNYYLWKELAVCQLSVAEWLNVLCVVWAVSAGLREDRQGRGPSGECPPASQKSNLVLDLKKDFHKNLKKAM